MITIGDGIPTAYCIQVNAHALARYAALCQEQGIVPIVEPEVLMDGDNDIETCYRATKRTLHKVFDELYHQRVDLEGMLLKPNMVISGKDSPTQASAEEVADWTLRCFRETVPAAVPGIVFLSGGQSDQQASENLNAINSRPAAVGALVLVRPRAPGARSGGVGRQRRTTSRLGSRSSRCAPGTTAPRSRAATRPRWSSSPARLDPPDRESSGVEALHLVERLRLVVTGVSGLAELLHSLRDDRLHRRTSGLEVGARVELPR